MMQALKARKCASAATRFLIYGVALLLLASCQGSPQDRSPENGGTSSEASPSERAQPARSPGESSAEAHDEATTGPLPRIHAPEAGEEHFGQLRMLSDGGENAEAYFSFDGQRLIFQSTRPPYECDQIFTMHLDATQLQMVSTGMGRTTCAYFMPGDDRIVYASTHHHMQDCPPTPDMSRGYVWALYPEYDIFVADADGENVVQLTDTWRYDAEATISPKGDKIVFTSLRDGDLEIYTMNLDGSDVRRLTHELGYDGGPFFSPDGSKIVYRSHQPQTDEEIADYEALLAEDRIRPSKLEIFVMDADGSNKRRVTDLDSASFAPFFHPSGEKIIFSTNYPDGGREFDLWMVNLDGSGLERITFSEGFDGFPMWAPDGETFVFASNRHNSKPNETNIFLTTWKD
jgi:Tol biopolymer transport system component